MSEVDTSGDFRAHVAGLDEMRKELRKASKKAGPAIGKANFEVGQQVVEWSRGAVRTGTGRKAFEKKAITATRKQRAATIRLDANKFGGTLGAEFGAKRWPQFEPWRGNQFIDVGTGVGYIVHPTIEGRIADIEDEYMDAIMRVLSDAFPDPA